MVTYSFTVRLTIGLLLQRTVCLGVLDDSTIMIITQCCWHHHHHCVVNACYHSDLILNPRWTVINLKLIATTVDMKCWEHERCFGWGETWDTIVLMSCTDWLMISTTFCHGAGRCDHRHRHQHHSHHHHHRHHHHQQQNPKKRITLIRSDIVSVKARNTESTELASFHLHSTSSPIGLTLIFISSPPHLSSDKQIDLIASPLLSCLQ